MDVLTENSNCGLRVIDVYLNKLIKFVAILYADDAVLFSDNGTHASLITYSIIVGYGETAYIFRNKVMVVVDNAKQTLSTTPNAHNIMLF